MSKSKVPTEKPRSLARGLIAGIAGGLAGAVAMAVVDRMFARQPREETAPPEAIHWGFGVAVGAAYGVVAEFYPAATVKEGATFGMALEGLTQRGLLPLKALPAEAEAQTLLPDVSSRLVYGVTTEAVRGLVRKHI